MRAAGRRNAEAVGPKPPTARRRWGRWVVGLTAVLVLWGWQLSLFRTDLQPTHDVKVTGLHSEDRFVYFLYYLHLWPVATTLSGRDWEFYFGPGAPPKEPNQVEYSPQAARRVIAEHGSTLVQEWGHTIRNENHLQTFLYLPDAWRRGSPALAETRLTNAACYMLALGAVFVGFLAVGRGVLGAIVVVLLGSNPFQVFAAYREENIKAWPITMFCVAVALTAPLLSGRLRRPAPVALILGGLGVAFGTAYHIRSEAACVGLGLIAVCLTIGDWSWLRRFASAALFATVFLATASAWTSFFHRKIAESDTVVAAAGGHVYTGPRHDVHPLWASLWPGLGDFDTKYGYRLGDDGAVRFLEPVMRQQYGEEIAWWWGTSRQAEGRRADDYYDADRIYYRYPFDSPTTARVLRDKVVHDVTHDPVWYFTILLKRAWRVLTDLTPVQVLVTPSKTLVVPFHGLVAVVVAVFAWRRRDWFALRLLLLAAPLSLMALFITTAGHFNYFSIYHLCAAAILGAWAWDALRTAVGRSRARNVVA